MKSVLLFRHGQAGWKNHVFGKDYDKPLTPIGIKDAEKMGAYLSKINNTPDLIISSTANRAKTTMELAYKAGAWESIINFETNQWQQVSYNHGHLDWLINPVELN